MGRKIIYKRTRTEKAENDKKAFEKKKVTLLHNCISLPTSQGFHSFLNNLRVTVAPQDYTWLKI